MSLKSIGDLVCTCDDKHNFYLTHSVRKDVDGWDVLTSPSNTVSIATNIMINISMLRNNYNCNVAMVPIPVTLPSLLYKIMACNS